MTDLRTRPSRPIRCDVCIVERMRYRQTDQPTDGHIRLLRCFVAPKNLNENLIYTKEKMIKNKSLSKRKALSTDDYR